MKKFTLAIVLAMTLLLAGCSKDAEINAFITEFDGMTNDIAAKIDSGDIDGAKAAFDAKKTDLKSKIEGIKTARGFQVSEETRKKFEASTIKNGETLKSSMVKNAIKLASDSQKKDKLIALLTEYGELFK